MASVLRINIDVSLIIKTFIKFQFKCLDTLPFGKLTDTHQVALRPYSITLKLFITVPSREIIGL